MARVLKGSVRERGRLRGKGSGEKVSFKTRMEDPVRHADHRFRSRVRVASDLHVAGFVSSGSNCGRLEVIRWYCNQTVAYAVKHPDSVVSTPLL